MCGMTQKDKSVGKETGKEATTMSPHDKMQPKMETVKMKRMLI